MSWDSDYGHGYVKPKYDTYKSRKRHEWTSTLLLLSTVYNCKHCGVKKEEVIDEEYCEEKKDTTFNNSDTGGW